MGNAPRIYVRGSYIDIHDNENVYLTVDKDGEVKTHIDEKQIQKTRPMPLGEIPDELRTAEARALHEKLMNADILDKDWQPVNLSNAEKGTLIECIAEKLNIRNKWKLFGNLWKMDSETLRTAKARGLDQDKTWKFREQLNAM